MNQKITFQKQRELGDIISDTFRFIRENFRLLFKMIFRICGPVFVILLLALTYYSYLGMDSFENPIFGNYTGENMDMYFISLFILFSALVGFYVLLYSTVLNYIRSYLQNEGTVNEIEVYEGVKNNFGGMLGTLLLTGSMIFVGLLLCFLPGIYLWVPLSIAPAILVFQNRSVIDSISESFQLVKDNWWITFFSLFVIVLLTYLVGLIFQVPMIFYMLFKTVVHASEIRSGDPSSLVDWVTITLNVISSLAQYLSSVIVIIASALIYHNLDEKKNATGSYRIISRLGSSENTQ